MNSYLVATSLEHCLQYVRGGVDFNQLSNCNVVIVLKTHQVVLAKVTPPNEIVEVVTNGSKFQVDVRDLYNTIQQSSICWCEI